MPEDLAPKQVQVISPSGELGTVAESELQNAVANYGYKIPSPDDLSEIDKQEKYGEGVLNPVKAFGAAAARTATFGLSDEALTKTGLSSPEALSERAKRNPISNFTGQAAGIVAPLVLAPEASAPGLVAKAGSAVTESALGVLPEATTAAGKILSSVSAHAAGSAVEGAAYGLGQSVSEHALGDPELTAQKVAANIGFGALAGGVVGGALGIPGAISDVAKSAREVVKDFKSEVASAGLQHASGDTIESTLTSSAIPAEEKQGILAGLTEEKANASEIRAAAKEINAPVLESQVSASKHVQDWDSHLSQSNSLIGIARQQKFQEGFNAVETAVKNSLGPGSEMTEVEVGNALKKGLIDRVEKEREPIHELYSALKAEHEVIPVSDRAVNQISKNMMKIDGISLSPSSPEYQLASSVSEEIGNLKNVDQIKQYRSILSRRATGNPELRFVVGQLQEKLGNLEENSILRFAEQNFKKGSPGSEKVLALIEQRAEANAKYRTLVGKMEEVGSVIGKRRVYGPQDFIDHVADMSPEALTKKLFAKGNSEFLQFFQEEFPEQTKTLTDFQKGKIRIAATKDGVLMPGKVLREFDKFSPEVKKILFTESELSKIKAAQTYTEAMPKNVNPSGTAKSLGIANFFSVGGAINTAKDAALLAAIKHAAPEATEQEVAKISTLATIERAAQKTTKQITSAVKEVFKYGAAVAPAAPVLIKAAQDQKESRESQLKDYRKRVDQITELASNPQHLMDRVESATKSIYPHAPGVAAGIQSTAVRGIQFLHSKVPPKPDRKPLSTESEPTHAEMTAFNKYWDAVENPVSVLSTVARGTISPESVEALSVVHPQLYNEMKTNIFDHITSKREPIPYKTRLALSTFMGQDLDGTASHESVAANQAVLSQMPKSQDNLTAHPQKHSQTGFSKLHASKEILTPMQAANQR